MARPFLVHRFSMHVSRPSARLCAPIVVAVVLCLLGLGSAGCTAPLDHSQTGTGLEQPVSDGDPSYSQLQLEPAFEPLTGASNASALAPTPFETSNLESAETRDSNSSPLRHARYLEPQPAAMEILRTGAALDLPQNSSVDTLGEALRLRLSQLIRELEEFQGREEAELQDGQRLRKHHIVMQLLHLHGLLPNEELAHLDPLLEALKDPHLPGTRYQLSTAAFFHDIGREDLRDLVLGQFGGIHTELSPRLHSPRERDAFDFRELHICRQILSYGQYDPFQRHVFSRDQRVHIYGELEQLSVESHGQQWRCGIKLEVFLRDPQGERVDSRILADNDWMTTADAERVDTHLCREYAFPLSIDPGEYRFEVRVTDLASGEMRSQGTDIQLLR